MKKLSRKQKLLLFLAAGLISLFFIFHISEWNSPTPEFALRRMEKRRLIGPSEIIAKLDFTDSYYDHLWIGECEDGYITFEFFDSIASERYYQLDYFPKTEDVTIFTTIDPYERETGEPWLPIFLFQESRNASSAQLKLTVTGPESSDSYQLNGQKMNGGYFLFSLPTKELKSEFFWLIQQAITDSYEEYVLTGTVEIQIDFYDSSGNLVDTYSKTVTK